MSRFDDHSSRRSRGLWPTAVAVAVGALLAAAPPVATETVRVALHNLAGPILGRLPAATEAQTIEEVPLAELAAEIARLRMELAAGSTGERADRLVRPSWLTAVVFGSTERRHETAELLIAAVGREAAAADAAGLNVAGLNEGSPDELTAIDAGADRQVAAGDLVVRDGAIVGRVAAAGRWTATVRAVTHPDFRLAVSVPGGGGSDGNAGAETTAVLAGADGTHAVLLHVPTARPVAVGAVVTCEAAETGGAAVPVGVDLVSRGGRRRRPPCDSGPSAGDARRGDGRNRPHRPRPG